MGRTSAPVGVMVICGLAFLGVILNLIRASGLMAVGAQYGGTVGLVALAVGGLLAVISLVWLAVIGGLLTLQGWAWTAAMGLFGLNLVLLVASLVAFGGGTVTAVQAGLTLLMMGYMYTVRDAYTTSTSDRSVPSAHGH